MNVARVVEKLQSDGKYAEELRAKFFKLGATDGKPGGAGKDELWRDLLSEFADDPDDLSRLVSSNVEMLGSTTWTTTVCTLTCTVLTPGGAPVTVTTITTMTTAQ